MEWARWPKTGGALCNPQTLSKVPNIQTACVGEVVRDLTQLLAKHLTFGEERSQELTQEQQVRTMKEGVEDFQDSGGGLWTLIVKLGVLAKFTLISQGQPGFIWDIFARIGRSFSFKLCGYEAMRGFSVSSLHCILKVIPGKIIKFLWGAWIPDAHVPILTALGVSPMGETRSIIWPTTSPLTCELYKPSCLGHDARYLGVNKYAQNIDPDLQELSVAMTTAVDWIVPPCPIRVDPKSRDRAYKGQKRRRHREKTAMWRQRWRETELQLQAKECQVRSAATRGWDVRRERMLPPRL